MRSNSKQVGAGFLRNGATTEGRCGVDKLTQTADSAWPKLWIQYLAPPMRQCSTKNQTQIPVFDITFLERNTLESAVN